VEESDNRSLKESVPNSCSKGLAVNPIDGPLTDSVSHPEPLASSSTLSSTITVPESVPAEAPANAFEFQKMWAHLSRSRDLTSLHQFFKVPFFIPHSDCFVLTTSGIHSL
jgi:hypothetical protein